MNKLFICVVFIVYSAFNSVFATDITTLNNGLPVILNNGIIKSGNNYFVATHDGLYLSENDGKSWSIVSEELITKGYASNMLDIDGTDFLLVNDEIIYQVTDNGSAFNKVSTGLPSAYTCVSLFKHDNVIYANLMDGNLYYSTNDGNSWIKTTENPPEMIMITKHFMYDGMIYLFTTSNVLYRIDKFGSSWENVSSGLPEYAIINSLIISDNTLYCAINQVEGIYQFNNELKNWSKANIEYLNNKLITGAVNFSNKICLLDNSKKIIISNDNLTDFAIGNSNKIFPGYLPNLTVIEDKLFVNCGNGNIYSSSSPEQRFEQFNNGLNNNLTIVDINKFNNKDIVISMYGSFYFDNNNSEWVIINNPNNEMQIEFLSAKLINNNYYTFAKEFGLLKLNQNENKWEIINNSVDTLIVDNIDGNENFIALGTYYNSLWLSTDGGTNFKQITIDGSINDYVDNQLVISGKIIISIHNRGVYVSEDKGETWTKKINGLLENPFMFQITSINANNNRIYCAQNGSGLYYTDYSLDSWKKIEIIGLEGLINNIVSYNDMIILRNNTNGLYISLNNGEDWELFNEGIPYIQNAFNEPKEYRISSIILLGNELYIASEIELLKKTLSFLSAEEQMQTLSVTVKAYPNPVTNELLIEIPYINSGYSMKIIDESGRVLFNIDDLDEGDYKHDFSKYPNGVYTIKIYNSNLSQVFKIVKN